MIEPYSKYQYSDCMCDCGRWAELCAERPDEPLLRQQDAVKLEHLYDEGITYTSQQHQANIRFLRDLTLEIGHIWTWEQRKKANMGSLVEDYKCFFGLEDL